MELRIWIPILFLVMNSAMIYSASLSDIWEITTEYGNGGFEAEVTIPIKRRISSWRVGIEFSTPLRSFQVFQAILADENDDQTNFVIENEIWNGDLSVGDELYFRVQGFATKADIPSVTVVFGDNVYEDEPEATRAPPLPRRLLRRIINADVDYQQAIRLSLKFFEAQRSGYLPVDNRISWKNNSGLYDGGIEGVNLVGGYYIGGDYVKHNFPMAFAVTQLVWGALEFGEGYESSGEMENLFKAVKWGTDYFLKCHSSEFEYYGMVGDPEIEKDMWENSQAMDWERPAYKITTSSSGSDLAAETAAALAAASILFETISPDYSGKLRKHAKQLWKFAEQYRGRYDMDGIPKASQYYGSSDYRDELVWAALWLHKATKDRRYLEFAESNYGHLSLNTDDGLSYDRKLLGIQLLLADLTGDYRTYMYPVKDFCNKPGGGSAFILPSGLIYKDVKGGPVLFAANSAYVCAIAARRSPGTKEAKKFIDFAKGQIHIMLGTRGKQSFMIGFGKTYPQRIHHRDSSCPAPPDSCGVTFYRDANLPNARELKGAIVGGPNDLGEYEDERTNSELNQPNILYNSAFQSAVAALIMFDEGDIDSSGAGSGDLWDFESFSSTSLDELFSRRMKAVKFDACLSNPCQNAGSCENKKNMEFVCNCDGNAYGRFCELKMNPEIEWVSTWPNGAQVHIHLPDTMLRGGSALHIFLPIDCPLVMVEVWQTCLVPELSSLENRTVVVRQVGWQFSQSFFGLKFEFTSRDFMRTCFNTEDFMFKTDAADPDSDARFKTGYSDEGCVMSLPIPEPTTPPTTTTKKPVFQTIRPFKGDRSPSKTTDEPALPDVLPTKITDKQGSEEDEIGLDMSLLTAADDTLINWMNTWGSGGTAHIQVAEIKAVAGGPWIMQFFLPRECDLSGAEFWHACIVPELSNPDLGQFTLYQVGWQEDQDSIGMTVHFADVLQTVDCFRAELYSVSFQDAVGPLPLDPNTCLKNFDHKMDRDESVAGHGESASEPTSSPGAAANSRSLTPKDPRDLRKIWLNATPKTTVAIERLRARVASENTVKLSWRKLKEDAKNIQITYESGDDVDEDSDDDEEAPVVKLKSAETKSSSVLTTIRKMEISASKKKIYVGRLLPGETYHFTAKAREGRFYGPSSTVTVTLAPSDIENIRTSNPNSTAIEFMWERPAGMQKIYKVTYFPQTETSYPKSPYEISGKETRTAVSGLDEDTDYIFVFVVKNNNVMSDGKYVFTKTGDVVCKGRTCPKNSECVHTEFGAKCLCDFGYKEHGRWCQDINECKEEKRCDAKAECTNYEGSFECTCKSGYSGDGFTCYDVNECLLDVTDVCSGEECINTDGSYKCMCEKGYVFDGSSCKDLDECKTGNSLCPKEAKCVNEVGTHTCICPDGLTFVEDHCEDVNECRMDKHNCKATQICSNTRGGFKCVCGKGMRTSEDGGCEDVDECRAKEKTCHENAACKNVRRRYRCICKKGYSGNGYICKDTDECKSAKLNKCDEKGGTCTNTIGSYQCSCKAGYTGDGKKCFPLL